MLGELAPAVVRNISRADPTQDHLAAARAAVAAVSACRSSALVCAGCFAALTLLRSIAQLGPSMLCQWLRRQEA